MAHVEVWQWCHIHHRWEKAPARVSTIRLVGTGQAALGEHDLYWMNVNPGVAASLIEITDAAAGGGVVVLDHFDTTRDGHVLSYSPPMHFDTGIWLETFTNMTSVTFGYI